MMKRRIAAVILAALAALSLCGCKNEGKRPAHTPNTYPADETVVIDKAAAEHSAREMAEQLLGISEEYTLTTEGEDYVDGGESIFYTVSSCDTIYRIAINYIGDRYVYSEEAGEYLTDTMWLFEQCGADREDVGAAATTYRSKQEHGEGELIVASLELIYGIPGAKQPAFEVLVKDGEAGENICIYGVMPDMKTVYTKVGEEFVLSE